MPILLAPISVTIPDGITDLESFRRWARSDEFPRHGHFAFYNGTLWADDHMEHAFSHNFVKGAISAQLILLIAESDLGVFFSDGMLLSNPPVGLSTEPVGAFVSHESFEAGTARGIGGRGDDYVELVGAPDMVLEVVSRSSRKKDVEDFPDLYYRAGVREYWLADARYDTLKFEIFRRGTSAFESIPADADGWIRSDVFDRSFRLIRGVNRGGEPKFTLEVR